jgi:glycosyltransferase involved in cell wall biosynthesis
MRAELEGQCARARLEGVTFTGFVDGTVKTALLAAAKWLVVPSHWQEPLGLVALEARSVGVPCIATRDGGLPEAAGTEALFCTPGDAVPLAAALRQASHMSEHEYAERSARTVAALAAERPLPSFYVDAYLQLRRGTAP